MVAIICIGARVVAKFTGERVLEVDVWVSVETGC